jgi:uncharacterized membrane-anchored protein
MIVHALLGILAVAIVLTVPDAAFAYIGPGAGLGLIGSLLAVLGAILLAIIGLIILPFRMLLKRRQAKGTTGQQAAGGQEGWSESLPKQQEV